MTIQIRMILIEALKPRETPLVNLAEAICSVTGVEDCDIVVTDVDVSTETIKLTVKGSNIEYEGVTKVMNDSGISVKGVDEISVSKSKQPILKTAIQ